MRYQLGYMDKYPFEVAGSVMENDPMYRITFKQPIDAVRLEKAVNQALSLYPLFKTQVGFDKEYYLYSNDQPVVLTESKESERPETFGKNTNGYPWQLSYYDRTMCFEWAHGITDGMGGLHFVTCVLESYFDCLTDQHESEFSLELGLEPFNDPKEKGIDYKTDPEGFSFRHFPVKYKDYHTDCHALCADTKEILEVAHNAHSSVAPVISILFSRALRLHLPKNIKNRKVACNVAMDLRRPLHYTTMHNCSDLKRVTYMDDYDTMSFSEVAKIYKATLDRARLRPNVIRAISDRIKLFDFYHIFPSRRWLKFVTAIMGVVFKNTDCNFVLTYPGKVTFKKEVEENIENIEFKVWHDAGQCVIAALDYKGRFNLNICENFVEKGVVEDFIKLSEELGIHWTETDYSLFYQGHFEE